MYYAPHVLYKKHADVPRDCYGRPILSDDSWEKVDVCRCDDESSLEVTDDLGRKYIVSHHIVCNRNVRVVEGDEVCVMRDGEQLCRGIVRQARKLNYLGYSELWV